MSAQNNFLSIFWLLLSICFYPVILTGVTFFSIHVFAFATGYQYAYSLHISWNRKRKLKKNPSFDFKWCSVRFKINELSFAPWNLMVLYWRFFFFLPISKLNTTTLVSAVTIQYFIMWRNIMSIPLCQYWRSLYWPFSKREIY